MSDAAELDLEWELAIDLTTPPSTPLPMSDGWTYDCGVETKCTFTSVVSLRASQNDTLALENGCEKAPKAIRQRSRKNTKSDGSAYITNHNAATASGRKRLVSIGSSAAEAAGTTASKKIMELLSKFEAGMTKESVAADLDNK